MSRRFVLVYGAMVCVLALAGLHATTIGFVSAITVLDSNDIGGASPWRSVLLSVLVSLMGSRLWPLSISRHRRQVAAMADGPSSD